MALSDYLKNLGRTIDPKDSKKAEDEAAKEAALKLSDLEAYYRDWVEGHLYHRQNVYTNPTLTDEDLAQLTQMDSDDFNRFLNAYLLILQEQGIDVNNPSGYMDEMQREMNSLDRQIVELEKKTRNKEEQAKYEELIEQRRLTEERYNKAKDIWKYTEDAREKGWTPDTVGDSGVDFDAINQSAEDRKYMQDRMAEGFGSGGDASGLWLPEEKPKPVYGYGGGVVGADEEGKGGVYVAPGKYTTAEFEEASVDPYARVGEDGLTGGQRLIEAAEARNQRQAAQRLASLVGQANEQASARNNTAGWTSEEYPDIDTRVVNANTSGVTMTDAGRAYLEALEAKEAEASSRPEGSASGADALAALLGGSTGNYSGRVTQRVGSTGLTEEETAQAQKDAYLAMLDAMARGRAATGGYTNSAALQAGNAVYDAYRDVLPKENLTAAYGKYLSDSGNRAGTPAYRWVNRNQNGGYGTTKAPAPATKPATQVQQPAGTIPQVSGGTPVSGTPVRQQQSGDIGTILSQLLGGGRTTGRQTTGYRTGGQLKTPNVMQAQNNIAQYLNSLLRR